MTSQQRLCSAPALGPILLGYEVTLTSFYEAFHIEKMKSWQLGQSGRHFLQRESFAAMKRAANAATRTTSPIVSVSMTRPAKVCRKRAGTKNRLQGSRPVFR